jgi:transcription elongation GreA/GreB family factor
MKDGPGPMRDDEAIWRKSAERRDAIRKARLARAKAIREALRDDNPVTPPKTITVTDHRGWERELTIVPRTVTIIDPLGRI